MWYSPVTRLHIPVENNVWGDLEREGLPTLRYYDSNPFLNPYSRKGAKSYSLHSGSDLNLKSNQDWHRPVYNMRDNGIVVGLVNLGGSWGNVWIIEYPDDRVWARYAHGEHATVRLGQVLAAGDQIGSIGDANGFYGPAAHLHLDISHTDILRRNPGHWAFANRNELLKHYLDPVKFLLMQGKIPARAMINTAVLRVRSDPSLDGTILARVYYGSVVEIEPTYTPDGKWVKLIDPKYKGGYIATEYIKRLA